MTQTGLCPVTMFVFCGNFLRLVLACCVIVTTEFALFLFSLFFSFRSHRSCPERLGPGVAQTVLHRVTRHDRSNAHDSQGHDKTQQLSRAEQPGTYDRPQAQDKLEKDTILAPPLQAPMPDALVPLTNCAVRPAEYRVPLRRETIPDSAACPGECDVASGANGGFGGPCSLETGDSGLE